MASVSGIRSLEQSAEGMIDSLESMLDAASGQSTPEPPDPRHKAQAGVSAHLGTACRRCQGGHSASGAHGAAEASPRADSLIQMLKPLLDMVKALLDSLKAQESTATAADPATAGVR